MKKLIICFLLFVLVGHVSATAGAKCSDNTLMYYDLSNTLIKRDCSLLHSGAGQIFRGICKEYEGGADCWRTEGAVTPEYRDAVRGYTYNSSNVWDPSFSPTTTTLFGVTTTTIRSFDITQCPKCEACKLCEDCQSVKLSLDSCNISLYTCKDNFDACSGRVNKMIYKDTYDNQRSDYESKLKLLNSDIAAKDKEIARLVSNGNVYYYLAIVSCIIVLFVVGVWVKYEWIGDPKLKDGLGIK